MTFKIERALSWITQRSELCNSVSQFLQNCSTPFSFHSCGVFEENSFILDYAAFGTMQLRFIIFYKIISLRSVFAPVEFSSKTLTSPINCYKQIQNWAVLALFYARMQRFFIAWRIRPYFIVPNYWQLAILAFRYAFSRLHSSGLLRTYVLGVLTHTRRTSQNLAFLRRSLTTSLYTRKLGRFLV